MTFFATWREMQPTMKEKKGCAMAAKAKLEQDCTCIHINRRKRMFLQILNLKDGGERISIG
jgi:hypothetical protein